MASCTPDEAESSSAASSRAMTAATSPSNRYREKSRFIEDLETEPSPELITRLLTAKQQTPRARPQAARAHSSPVVITLRPPPPAPLRLALPRNGRERKKRPSSGLFSFFSPPVPAASLVVPNQNSPPIQRRSSIFRRGSISPAVRSTGTQPLPSEVSAPDSYFPPEKDWRFWRRRRSTVLSSSEDDGDPSRRKSFAFGETTNARLSPLEPPRLRVNSGGLLGPRSSSPLVHSVVSDASDDADGVSPTALEMIDEAEASPALTQQESTNKELSFRKLPKEMYTLHTRRRSGSAAEAVPGLAAHVRNANANATEEKLGSIRRRAVSVLGLTRPSWVSEEFGTGTDDEDDSDRVAALPAPAPALTPTLAGLIRRAAPTTPPPRVSSLPPLIIQHYPTPAFPALSSSVSTSTVDNDNDHDASPVDADEASVVARPSEDESDGTGGWQRKLQMKERERERERWWALSKRATREIQRSVRA